MELYFHSPIRLPGLVLNYATIPYHSTTSGSELIVKAVQSDGHFYGFEDHEAKAMNNTVLLVVKQCDSESSQIHLHFRRVSQAINKQKATDKQC
jgi:hypothetical protein